MKLKKIYNTLSKKQKINLFLLIIVVLSLSYLLTIALVTYHYLPIQPTNSKIKNAINIIPLIYKYYDFKTPILAFIKGGADIVIINYLISLLIVSIFCSISVYLAMKRKKNANIHGKASWSTKQDLEKSKLMRKKGILVGLWDNIILYFDSPEFVSLGSPTRSNKGTGIVIPNFMTWQESLVGLDVKQECYDYTSKYRKDVLGQEVFIFNPFSENTHRYNPLGYLDFSSPKIELDIQNIANNFYDPNSKDFFLIQGRTIFIAITYLFGIFNYNERLATTFSLTTLSGALNGVDIIKDGKTEKIELELASEIANNLGWLPDTIYNMFLSFFSQKTAEKQFEGVKGSYETGLSAFKNEVIGNSTSENDFDLRDLRRKKMTIYLVINPKDLITAKPILSLFFTQLIDTNIEQGLPDQNPEIKHGVLMLMDEFTSMGYMEKYLVATGFMAGYWLRSLIIYQSDAQLSDNKPVGYGTNGATTLLENHACNIIYRPTSVKTAEDISKRIGNITTIQSNRSISKKDAITTSISRSENTISRPLILPQEIMELAQDEEIILYNGMKVKCKKANYFSIPFLINKFKSVSPFLKNIKGNPTEEEYKKAVQMKELSIPLPSKKSIKKELF